MASNAAALAGAVKPDRVTPPAAARPSLRGTPVPSFKRTRLNWNAEPAPASAISASQLAATAGVVFVPAGLAVAASAAAPKPQPQPQESIRERLEKWRAEQQRKKQVIKPQAKSIAALLQPVQSKIEVSSASLLSC